MLPGGGWMIGACARRGREPCVAAESPVEAVVSFFFLSDGLRFACGSSAGVMASAAAPELA